MTSDKARKAAIRSRMEKTGESYTSARRIVLGEHLVEPSPAAENAAASVTGGDALAPLPPRIAEPEMSEEAIQRATGKSWDDWFRLLDAWDGTSRTHTEIARYVDQTYPIGGWWAQSVTVGYERARGMRAVHERPDGFYAGISKTFAVPVARLAQAFLDDQERDAWLAPETVRERSSTAGKSWRFETLDGRTRGDARFSAKGDAKSSVAVQHDRLRDADEVAHWKAWWSIQLNALNAKLKAEQV